MRLYPLLFALLSSAIAVAQEKDEEKLPRWYQLEIVVFQQLRMDTEENFDKSPFDLETSSLGSQATNINSLLSKANNGEDLPPPLISQEDIAEEAIEPNTGPLDIASELAANEFSSENPEDLATEGEPQEIWPDFLPVTQDQLILTDYKNKLARRSAYRVLWHGAWQQPLEESSPVNEYVLSAGNLLLQPPKEDELTLLEEPAAQDTVEELDRLVENLSNAPAELLTEPSLLLDPAPALSDAEIYAQRLLEAEEIVATAPPTFRELQGSFQIYKTRFAHLEFDLWFATTDLNQPGLNIPYIEYLPNDNEEGSDAEIGLGANTISAKDFVSNAEADSANQAEIPAQSAEPLPKFELKYELAYTPELFGQIKEDRRLRPEELYYVDHPMFGMIVKMIEVEHPSLRVPEALESAEEPITDPLAF